MRTKNKIQRIILSLEIYTFIYLVRQLWFEAFFLNFFTVAYIFFSLEIGWQILYKFYKIGTNIRQFSIGTPVIDLIVCPIGVNRQIRLLDSIVGGSFNVVQLNDGQIACIQFFTVLNSTLYLLVCLYECHTDKNVDHFIKISRLHSKKSHTNERC